MKKSFILFLALCLMLAACGAPAAGDPTQESTEPVSIFVTDPTETEPVTEPETEPATEPATEPEEPPVPPRADATVAELLQSGDAVTVSYAGYAEYINKLRELGYTEFIEALRFEKNMPFVFTSLTYNEEAFRLEFTYLAGDNGTEEGWILYGTKGEGLANISDIDLDGYLDVMAHEDSRIPERAAKAMALNSVPLAAVTSLCAVVDVEKMEFLEWTLHTSLYYYKSGNLYNYVRTADSPETGSHNYPAGELLMGWEEMLNYDWDELDLPLVLTHCESDGMFWDFLYYEENMTWEEWCESKYNVQGWTYIDEGDGWLVDAFDQYVIQVVRDENGDCYPMDAFKTPFHPYRRLNGEPYTLCTIEMLTISEARALGYPG